MGLESYFGTEASEYWIGRDELRRPICVSRAGLASTLAGLESTTGHKLLHSMAQVSCSCPSCPSILRGLVRFGRLPKLLLSSNGRCGIVIGQLPLRKR